MLRTEGWTNGRTAGFIMMDWTFMALYLLVAAVLATAGHKHRDPRLRARHQGALLLRGAARHAWDNVDKWITLCKLLFRILLPACSMQAPRCLNLTFVPLQMADWSPHLNIRIFIHSVFLSDSPRFISDTIRAAHTALFHPRAVHLTEQILQKLK